MLVFPRLPWAPTVSALVLFALLGGCGQAAPAAIPTSTPPAATAPALQVAEVARGSLSIGHSYPGNILAKQQVGIVPKVGGRVIRIHVEVGSTVKAGATLVELDQDALVIQVAQAEAALALARARVRGMRSGARPEQLAQAEAAVKAANELLELTKARNKATIAQGEAALRGARAALTAANEQLKLAKLSGKKAVISQAEAAKASAEAAGIAADEQLKLAKQSGSTAALAQAEAAQKAALAGLALAKEPVTVHELEAGDAGVAQALAALDLAKLQLAESVVKAPFGGIVLQRLVSEGSMAGPATPLLSLMSSELEVVINVEERNLDSLKVGQTATLVTSAYPDRSFPLTTKSIAPSIDPRSRTVQVRLSPVDPEGKLRDGMFAQVSLTLEGKPNSLLVPRSAIVEQGNESVVFVISDGMAHRTVVKLGEGDDERVEVVDVVEVVGGLAEGQRVATSGLSGLKDNQVVTIR